MFPNNDAPPPRATMLQLDEGVKTIQAFVKDSFAVVQ